MHTIIGATGNVGCKLVQILLSKKQGVRAVGRSLEKLQPLVDLGAEPVLGDATDQAFLTEALTGADMVFAMIPPSYAATDFRAYQNAFGGTTAAAITASGVTHVVNLSSHGAHLSEKTGPIMGLRDQEQRLNDLDGVHVMHLRPTFFMENLLMNIPMIKRLGINGSHIKGDHPFAMIATQDIAQAAADHMMRRDFSGKMVRELFGPRDITMVEATGIIGEKIGLPDLKYIFFSEEEYVNSLLEAGLSADLAHLLAEMSTGINDSLFACGQKRTAENTTTTGFDTFADFFAQVYQS
jgi:uncharacterized protein YbjT (DUF2867 family)